MTHIGGDVPSQLDQSCTGLDKRFLTYSTCHRKTYWKRDFWHVLLYEAQFSETGHDNMTMSVAKGRLRLSCKTLPRTQTQHKKRHYFIAGAQPRYLLNAAQRIPYFSSHPAKLELSKTMCTGNCISVHTALQSFKWAFALRNFLLQYCFYIRNRVGVFVFKTLHHGDICVNTHTHKLKWFAWPACTVLN